MLSWLAALAVNLNLGGDESIELADRGGVKVHEGVVGFKSWCELGMAEHGVSGYVFANGSGVRVC